MNRLSHQRYKDLTGLKVFKLTAIKFSHTQNGQAFWDCICECNPETIIKVRANCLTHKNKPQKSCGCANKDKSIQAKLFLKDLTNQVFGELTVISLAYKKKKTAPSQTGFKAYWNCICKCGNSVVVEGGELKRKDGTRRCSNSIHILGEKHHNWRFDLSEEERGRLFSEGDRYKLPEYTKWRNEVYKRDNYTCQITGEIRGGKGGIQAHHLYNFRDHPNKGYDIDNGITICTWLHKLFHKLYGKRNNTPADFEEFKFRYNSGEFWSDYSI